jgi:glutaredoxin-like protein NrdH
MIKVWSNENCIQCERTKKFLDQHDIPYLELSLVDNPERTKKFIDQGFRSAPIVETEHKTWSGFRMNELNGLLRQKENDDSHSR